MPLLNRKEVKGEAKQKAAGVRGVRRVRLRRKRRPGKKGSRPKRQVAPLRARLRGLQEPQGPVSHSAVQQPAQVLPAEVVRLPENHQNVRAGARQVAGIHNLRHVQTDLQPVNLHGPQRGVQARRDPHQTIEIVHQLLKRKR